MKENMICLNCNGKGEIECSYCYITKNQITARMHCPYCNDKGFIVCSACNGTGKIPVNKLDFYENF